jgi:hypothetical protein
MLKPETHIGSITTVFTLFSFLDYYWFLNNFWFWDRLRYGNRYFRK